MEASTGEIDQIPDPDDTGSDTFKRFRYQAEAAFPSCLDLALVRNVVSITPERIEDLLIEQADRWRFVQIKTRDPGLNAFTFSDLLAESGALRSVTRTHAALADFDDGREIRYEIWLERGARSADPIERLVSNQRVGPDDAMVERCADRLDVDEDFARAMLNRCHVHAPLPPRELIRDTNIRNLQRVNPAIQANVTEGIYDNVISVIETAMRAELLQEEFPHCLMVPDGADEALAEKIAGKKLDQTSVSDLFQPLQGGNPAVLEQITDPDQLAATELDRKLVAAGVGTETREQAKVLRANATRRMYESSTGLSDPDAQFSDLDIRALTVAHAAAGEVTSDPPGPAVFNALLGQLGGNPAVVDPNHMLGRDPMLLLGRICDLSDRCQFQWGIE